MEILQSVWHAVLGSLSSSSPNWVDFVILVTIVCGIMAGIRRGLVSQVVGLVAVLLGLKLAMEFCQVGADALGGYLPASDSVRIALAFAGIFAVVAVACRVVALLWRSITAHTPVSWLDSTGGAVVGGLRVLIIAAVLVRLASVMPLGPLSQSVQESVISRTTGRAVEALWSSLPALRAAAAHPNL